MFVALEGAVSACGCVCVCDRDTERHRERERDRKAERAFRKFHPEWLLLAGMKLEYFI